MTSTWVKLAIVSAICLSLAACSSPARTPAPVITQGPENREGAALAMDSIRVVWGDSDWYTDVGRVEMFGSDLVVHVSASVDQATAERICHAVAVSHFDENAEPIGYLTVHVRSTYELANCPIS